MNKYLESKSEDFKNHPLGSFVRRDVPKVFKDLLTSDNEYTVTASVGQGNWAAVPWIAIMNKKITTSTQRGYYIVYLFSEDMTKVYLTIAQGVTETSKEDIELIKNRIRYMISDTTNIKRDDDIELGDSKRATDYANSTAAYIHYDIQSLPEEDTLVSDLKEMTDIYEKYIKKHEDGSWNNDDPTGEEIEEPSNSNEYGGSTQNLIDHIHKYIKAKGFQYTRDEIINYFLSLKTKPFVILSGISGTGKTKITELFSESIGATEENGQFSLIPVRPDWNDGSDLLGYIDIQGEFKEGPLTKIIKKAQEDPINPYFAVLDEMNLARVEHYFSDILSVMETRKWKEGQVVTSHLLTEETAGLHMTLPANLFMVGTVNMDETTHPFSKKVLDRANTLEFNKIDLGNLAFLEESGEVESLSIGYERFSSSYLHLKDVYKKHKDLVHSVIDELNDINRILEPMYAHVGYRVRDEISFYIAYNEEAELLPFEQALDYCILQKILPRVTGSDLRVDRALKELYKQFTQKEYSETTSDLQLDSDTAKYPQSASKVLEMLRRLEEDGFTSFWIS